MFKEGLTYIIERLKVVLDLKKIDDHQSLTFIRRNYSVNPSDICALLIMLIGILIIFIQGLKIIVTVMCYLLPIGILVLKMAQNMQTQKQKSSNDFQSKNISIKKELNRQNQNQAFEKTQQSIRRQSDELTQQSSSLSQQKSQRNKLSQQKIPSNKLFLNKISDKKFTSEQICKIFIAYLAINLFIDLIQPLILIMINYILSMLLHVLITLANVFLQSDYGSVLYIPIEFIAQFFRTLTYNQIGLSTQIVEISLRIYGTVKFLSNKQKAIQAFDKIFLLTQLPRLTNPVNNEQRIKEQ